MSVSSKSPLSLTAIRRIYTCNVLHREAPKNLKNKKHSSQQWLVRQLRDPYVEKAKQQNYRCRSAFKLVEINERFGILEPGFVVIDCGAAPGSWSQVAARLTNSNKKMDKPVGKVISIDRLPIFPIDGVVTLGSLDFTLPDSQKIVHEALSGKLADLVMSDMAPNASGIRQLDHENIIKLCYLAMKFALQVTRIDGTFVTKVWDGGRAIELERDLGRFYKSVRIMRPQATRDESTEKFILARGFKGLKRVNA